MSPIRPVSANRPASFTGSQDLRGMVVSMISTNSLAAFTAEVSRSAGISPVRGPSSTTAPDKPRVAAPIQRPLEALPPAPPSGLPRGSLLDLRV